MKAMLFVDCQDDFFGGGALEVPNAEEIRPVLKKLMKLAKDEKIPVLKTMDAHVANDPEFTTFPPHCIKETNGQASIVECSCTKAIVFEKATYDVFDKKLGSPNIESYLKDNNITEVWIAGVVGNICVEAAVTGLRKLGITTYVFENAVTWMDMEAGVFCQGADDKETSVKRLRALGAHLAQVKL